MAAALKNEVDAEQFAELVREATGCCLSSPEPFELARILASSHRDGDFAESESLVVFESVAGFVGVFFQYEDATGHGCQCASGLDWFATFADAWTFGLTDGQRDELATGCV